MQQTSRFGIAGETTLLKITIPNDPVAVREALSKVGNALESIPASDDFQSTSQIVMAEALNNIVEHAYDQVGSGQIELILRHKDQDIQVELRDQGRPMPDEIVPNAKNPNNRPDPGTLPEGGFGWKIINDLTLDLNYHREDRGNVLRFRLQMAQMA